MSQANERKLFHDTVRAFEAEIANAGAHMHLDAEARAAYATEIRKMSAELMKQAESGAITWTEAARKAQETRNAVMDIMRDRSTPVGRAIAQDLKIKGKTLNEMIARKTGEVYGASARFENLSNMERNRVFAKIVESAGSPNDKVSSAIRRAGHAGRGLIVLSIALSVYNVAVAEDKGQAIAREVSVTAGSISGGIAGGAVAGIACGSGAPVCVAVGAFIGGALAAFGISWLL